MKANWRSSFLIWKPRVGPASAVKLYGGKVKSTGKRFDRPSVIGWLHEPEGSPRAAMTLFHGAGSNCESDLMKAVAEAFCEAGYLVFRGDLPFRQERKPPRGDNPRDREGIRRALEELREIEPSAPVCLAGHSYGGRQS